MSGRVIQVCERRVFNFSNLKTTGGSNTAEVFVLENIDIAAYKECTLEIRVHAKDITQTATLQVIPYAVAPSTEDPSNFFRYALTSTTMNSGTPTSVPSLVLLAIPANSGAWLSIAVKGTQDTTTAGNISVTLSMVFSLKE